MEERLQKIIARAGIGSRRAAEKMITEGRVSVNGAVVTELGVRADAGRDEIRVDAKLISSESTKVYFVLNKPRGYVTTMNDPQKRRIVTELLPDIAERVFPVGRLDYDSEGLLFMTNDGDFAQKLLHPRFMVPKTYRAKIEGRLTVSDIRALTGSGVELEDGKFKAHDFRVERTNGASSSWVVLTVGEGRNRVIRRAFEQLGHPVVRLVRVAIADLVLGDLKPGMYRSLTKKEVAGFFSPRNKRPAGLSDKNQIRGVPAKSSPGPRQGRLRQARD
jgi:23S rRNA pseudouridine2605 synthase